MILARIHVIANHWELDSVLDALKPSYFALLLSLVPGLGHFWIGRSRRGLVHFAAVTGFLNLGALAALLAHGPLQAWGVRAALVVGVGFWIHSIFDLARLAWFLRLPRARERRSKLFLDGFDRFIRGDLPRARARFERMLESDRGDALARLYLCVVERRSGHLHSAITHAGQALACAPRNPFHRELKRELRTAKEALCGR